MGGFATALSYGRSLVEAWTGPTGAGLTAWFLAAMFVFSGIAKIRRPTLAAMAMVDFGVVRRVDPRLGQALGFGELVLAAALVITPSWASIVMASVLWIFTVLIGRILRSGETISCFCFGDAGAPLSRITLARTAVLAVAATVLAASAPARPSVISGELVLQVLVVVGALGLIVLGARLPDLLRWNRDPFGLELEAEGAE